MKVKTKGIRKGSLFKLIFVSLATIQGVYFMIVLLAGLIFGTGHSFSGTEPTKIELILGLIVVYPVLLFTSTLIAWLSIGLGMWGYTRFRPIELDLITLKERPEPD